MQIHQLSNGFSRFHICMFVQPLCIRTPLSVPLFPLQFIILLHLQRQELMLQRGMAWHYIAYDQRAEFAEVAYRFFPFVYPIKCDTTSVSWMLHEQWEQDARARRVGLWASSNPEEPWAWRRRNRRRRWWCLDKSDYPALCHSREMQLADCWSRGLQYIWSFPMHTERSMLYH